MFGLNWKFFVYGGFVFIVVEFGKNVKIDKFVFYGIDGSLC